MNPLDEVARTAARYQLRLRRAWPRTAEHLLLELEPERGPAVAGQWFADADRAAAVAAQTGSPASSAEHLVLQPAGADRRLTSLARLLREPHAVLLSHRPERRAVIWRQNGSYRKVVRPGQAAKLARMIRAVEVPGLQVPDVLDVDVAAGVVTTAALPGRTLHDLLLTNPQQAVHAAAAVGRAVASLHASPAPAGAALHDGAAELAVTRRWERLAHEYGRLSEQTADVADLAVACSQPVLLHRDLHDKQALVDPGGNVGLLDFDLAATGEAALDLANLLVHIELRAHQGALPLAVARAAAYALLDGYSPSDAVLARLPAYDLAARRRLRAVYAFRPAETAARRLLPAEPDEAP